MVWPEPYLLEIVMNDLVTSLCSADAVARRLFPLFHVYFGVLSRPSALPQLQQPMSLIPCGVPVETKINCSNRYKCESLFWSKHVRPTLERVPIATGCADCARHIGDTASSPTYTMNCRPTW
jgi:hypothetical protein